MADFPAMPFWTDAYLSDTRHLTTQEHGAYLLLLFEAWRRPGCSLPDDDRLLSRLAGLGMAEWAACKPVVMAFWTFDGRSKTWHQKRQKKERDYVSNKSRSQRDKAVKRWSGKKKDDAVAMPKACRSDAPTPTPIPISDTNVSDADDVDFAAVIFDRGVKFLVGKGTPERQARSVIGKWRKDHDDRDIFDAFAAARKEGVVDPVPWITARLKPRSDNTIDIRAILEGRA